MEEYTLIKNYRDNEMLRASFNELAEKTFGIWFEDWYRNGYWGDAYNPYSMVYEGKVVANVSVNQMDFIWDGVRKHFLQLGTVMTDEAYRHQGLIRELMDEIDKDYEGKADGMFLFANDSVLDFYPKFGFKMAEEYQYTKKVSFRNARSVIQIPMREKSAWNVLENAVNRSVCNSRFGMVGNSGLTMFYVTKYMQENVYYDKKQEAYVIAEIEEDELFIHSIFSEQRIDLEGIIEGFGREIRRVRLGFIPEVTEGYTVLRMKEEDCTLFLKGSGFDGFEQSRVMFSPITHA